MKTALLGAFLFVVSLVACKGADEKPSPAPPEANTPASAEAGASSSSSEGPKTASNDSSSQGGDGGVKGDGGYFAGGSALPR